MEFTVPRWPMTGKSQELLTQNSRGQMRAFREDMEKVEAHCNGQCRIMWCCYPYAMPQQGMNSNHINNFQY